MGFSFIQISDTHIFSDNRNVYNTSPLASLEYAVDDIKSKFPAIDFIIHTGDISGLKGEQEDYLVFNEVISKFKTPIQYLPGNHDPDPDVFKKRLSNTIISSKNSYWEFTKDEILFVGLDSSTDKIDTDQLIWLQNILEKNKSRRTLLFLHHHVLPVGAHWIDVQILKNNLELLNLIDRYDNIGYIVHGHLHMEKEILFRNKVYLSVPSLCFQSSDKFQTFSLDDSKPGYRVFEIQGDVIKTQVRRLSV